MICDLCDKKVNKDPYRVICLDCIKPGSIEWAMKKKDDHIQRLMRIIDDQRREIMGLKGELDGYNKA